MAEGQKQVRIRINDRAEKATYVNAFRTETQADEFVLEVGMNTSVQNVQGDDQVDGEIRFDLENRLVMNPYTAKRLAITLGNYVRDHEEKFGELKLNAADRLKK
ncbi:DUF3467 domain-containing protein [Planctomycetota bacterium]|nr:DUF3467 domain-containing protein [Planctomycetota bacterium]